MKKIIVCITGASGIIYSKRLLEELNKIEYIETTLIISKSAKKLIEYELKQSVNEFINLANEYYENDDFFTPVASGSNKFNSVVVVPCSMKTLSSIANGYGNNLINRVCDIALKEQRKLIIMPREMPVSTIHLENMLKLSKCGVLIMPPIPAYYHNPKSIDDIVNFIVGRILDNLNIENNLFNRWGNNKNK